MVYPTANTDEARWSCRAESVIYLKKDGCYDMKRKFTDEEKRLRKNACQRRYQRENREKANAYARDWYHRLSKKAKLQRYLKKLEYYRDYYLKNKEKLNKRSALWMKTHPEESKEHHYKWVEKNRAYWNAYVLARYYEKKGRLR